MSFRATITLYVLAWTVVLLLGATLLPGTAASPRRFTYEWRVNHNIQHVNWSE